ncbi:MAG: multidrug efflux system outer membrane protein [Verrucomicrobiales bacterium]|jgi:multidrug efflux system outer membrane protein
MHCHESSQIATKFEKRGNLCLETFALLKSYFYRMRSFMSQICLIVLTFVLASCAAFQIEKPTRSASESLKLPELWTQAGKGNEGKIAMGWLAAFSDGEMEKLVQEAMTHNFDLQSAASRLQNAKEGTVLGRAGRLPNFSISGSGSRSGSRSQDGSGDLGPWDQSTNYGLSLNTSWEIDLWGRLRDLEEATVHDYVAARADFRSARLSLAANTAKAWCNLIAAGQQVESAILTRESFLRNYRITERNYKGGDLTASPLSVQFGRNNVASAERSLLARRLGKDNSARALEVLLGRYPSAEIQEKADLPNLPKNVPVGLPSELLMRRPDLMAAAADVLASASRAEASRKSLLPPIRLSGGASTSSQELLDLIADPRSIAWNVASSIAQTIYQGGAPSAQARRALINNKAAIENFASTALRAFREVESTLATDHSLAEQEIFLDTELKQAILAEQQSERDFTEGLASTLEVLEAQRRANNARNSMIALRNQRLQNRIDLHLALGGDFETTSAEPSPSS